MTDTVRKHPYLSAILVSGVLHLGLFVLAMGLGPGAPTNSNNVEIRLFESGTSEANSPRLVKKSSPLKSQKIATVATTETAPSSPDGSDLADPTALSASAGGGDRGSARNPVELYAQDILKLIHERKFYPRIAQKMGHKGRVLVKFRVARNGEIMESMLSEKSLHESLNEAAQNLVKNLPRLKPFPAEIAANSLSFDVPIDYK